MVLSVIAPSSDASASGKSVNEAAWSDSLPLAISRRKRRAARLSIALETSIACTCPGAPTRSSSTSIPSPPPKPMSTTVPARGRERIHGGFLDWAHQRSDDLDLRGPQVLLKLGQDPI